MEFKNAHFLDFFIVWVRRAGERNTSASIFSKVMHIENLLLVLFTVLAVGVAVLAYIVTHQEEE